MDIRGDYQDLILAALDADPRNSVYQGVRKIVSGATWRPPDDKTHGSFSYEGFGYGANKEKQLIRNYVNDDEFARVKAILDKRRDQSFTSVAVSLRGNAKESRSMGWCMLSLVITRVARPQKELVEFHYRSTELILKFGADLVFARNYLLPQLGLHPSIIRYRFANAFISGVYFPYICTWWDPIDFLTEVKERDPRFFGPATRFFLRSAYKKDQVFPFSPENVAHRYAWQHLGKQKMHMIRDFLEAEHQKFGKPLPKLHYAAGEYIPRGKRKERDNEHSK